MNFEVVLYNEAVRARVREGLHHRQLSDDWGDSHYLEIKADDEATALAKVEQRYPRDKGYVVEGISLV